MLASKGKQTPAKWNAAYLFMAPRRVAKGTGSGVSGGPAGGYWSRCEAALAGSRVSLAAADHDGRYTWLFNAPPEVSSDLVGKLDHEVFPAETAAKLATAKHAALAAGESRLLEVELSGARGPRWFSVDVRPHFEQGAAVGTVLALIDITESKVQDEHLRIVLRELAHRSKNLLSVIQGIARQTAESASSTEQFLTRLNGRIFSLSRAHDVLTDADWRGARIFDLVQSQLALYADNRLAAVVTEGENAYLRPNAAQYVGLALHELTTNAMKYGALSRDDGVIVVRFEKSSGDSTRYRFSWTETSGAGTHEPSGRSFGILMLTDVVPMAVSGAAALSFPASGLNYMLELPKAQLLA